MPISTLLARRYDTGEAVRLNLAGDRITAVEPAWPTGPIADWPFVAPGLFDLQINGYGGVWFSDPGITPAQVVQAIEPYFAHGVTRLCPTLVTNSHAALAAGFSAIRQAVEQHPWLDHVIPGCHLEGPYLSGEDGPRGAHPRAHIRPADWDEFCTLQRLSGNRIRLVTIAPEVPRALDFIQRAVESGVRIAIGHTAATCEQIQQAIAAGATLSTHLGNGAHPIIRRHPNYIWEQLGDARLSASLITDGQHLPASVIRSLVRAKTPQQTIITCDASGWAGCQPGTYENDLGRVLVLEDGRIVVADRQERDILAGSGAATDHCVAHAAACGAVTLREAIDMACRNPTRFFGYPEQTLRAGHNADLFVYRLNPPGTRLTIVQTIVAGVVRFGTPLAPAAANP
ncbi:MAG: amidohydrolase family protein [Planctomycetes bacterium]|nr:amidohydrolase family protein [Planctomycetota bacterium]